MSISKRKEPVEFNSLPKDVMARIFEYATFSNRDEDKCKICRRYFYWLLDDVTAARIKAVCSTWRSVFKWRVVLRLRPPVDQNWCLVPVRCLQEEHEHVRGHTQLHRLKFFVRSRFGDVTGFGAELEEEDSAEER